MKATETGDVGQDLGRVTLTNTGDKIRVLIVDDIPETRDNLRKLLQFESDIEVVGQASTGEESISLS